MEDKLINYTLVGEEFLFYNLFFFFFLHSIATHQHFEQRGATGRINLDFFQNHLKP